MFYCILEIVLFLCCETYSTCYDIVLDCTDVDIHLIKAKKRKSKVRK